MHVKIVRSPDHQMLEKLIANTKLPMDYCDKNDRRIGEIVRLWRDGDYIMADVRFDNEHRPGPEAEPDWQPEGAGDRGLPR